MRVSLRRHRFGRLAVPVVVLFLAFVLAAGPAQARDLRASLKGVVLDAATKKGVPGVRVYVMEKVYPWGPGTPGQDHDWEPLASGKTSKSGSYAISLPRAGTFRVYFVPADRTRWAMEAYPNAPVPEWGDDVVVKYGAATSGISVKLDPANRIEGHIYDARSRWDAEGNPVDASLWSPLEGLRVAGSFQGLVRINSYVQYPDEPLSEDLTDANGFYSLPGFKPYPFFAWVFDEVDDETQFADLIVSDGTSEFPNGVKVLDAFLQPTDFVNIRGRLVDDEGNGLPGKWINVYISDFSPELERPFYQDRSVETNSEGYFECVHLPEPAALLSFEGDEDFVAEFYDNADFWDAPEISVDWGRINDIGDWVISRYPSGEQ